MALQWQEKRTITILSTTGTSNVIEVRTRRGQLKEKPEIVQLYNNNMLGVDKMDQLATYYSFLRKSVKWWRKVMFWLLEVSVVNTYIVYTTRLILLQQQPLTHLNFRCALIQGLVSHRLQVPHLLYPGRWVDMSLERMRPIPYFSKEDYRQLDCRVCRKAAHNTIFLSDLLRSPTSPPWKVLQTVSYPC